MRSRCVRRCGGQPSRSPPGAVAIAKNSSSSARALIDASGGGGVRRVSDDASSSERAAAAAAAAAARSSARDASFVRRRRGDVFLPATRSSACASHARVVWCRSRSSSSLGLGASGCLPTQQMAFVTTRPSKHACAAPLRVMCATQISRWRAAFAKPSSKLMSDRQKVDMRRSSFSSGSLSCQPWRRTFFRLTTLRLSANASGRRATRAIARRASEARRGGNTARTSASTSACEPWAKLRIVFGETSTTHSEETARETQEARACASQEAASHDSAHASVGAAADIAPRREAVSPGKEGGGATDRGFPRGR